MQNTRVVLVAVCVLVVAFGGGAATYAQLSDTETAEVSAAAGQWTTTQTVACGLGANDANGVGKLTLRYNGDQAATIRVTTANKKTEFFSGAVQPGEEFTFEIEQNGNGDLKLFVDGEVVASIHVSCSEPLGPGTEFDDGRFTVIAGEDEDGNELAPVSDTEQEQSQMSVSSVATTPTMTGSDETTSTAEPTENTSVTPTATPTETSVEDVSTTTETTTEASVDVNHPLENLSSGNETTDEEGH